MVQLLLFLGLLLRRRGWCRLSWCSWRCGSKAVQVMRDVVAETAFRELGQHCCRVRFAVAALALRHHLVFSLVTGYAGQVLVLEGTGR